MPDARDYYRDKARRCRELAETSISADTRADLLGLARQYDLLGEYAESKAKRRYVEDEPSN
jgi:hypothetical protein